MIQTTTVTEVPRAFPGPPMPHPEGPHPPVPRPYHVGRALDESNPSIYIHHTDRHMPVESASRNPTQRVPMQSSSTMLPAPSQMQSYHPGRGNISVATDVGASRTRGVSSYPPSPLAGRPTRLSEPQGMAGRGQLPSLSQILQSEPHSGLEGPSVPRQWQVTPPSDRSSPGQIQSERMGVRVSPSSDPAAYRLGSRAPAAGEEHHFRPRSMSLAAITTPSQSASTRRTSAGYVESVGSDRSAPAAAAPWSFRADRPDEQRLAFTAGQPLPVERGYPRITVETSVSKEPIGPSIWTGTHFLPRFVGERNIAGEGPCYFYDDGSRCKTVIDGEVVNAHWGVTKAGKPRKRLAVACLTCRDKKIKCDPDYPKCVQCEKFGRVCKFKNAPRGTRNSPDSTAYDSQTLLSAGTSASPDARDDMSTFTPKDTASPSGEYARNMTNGKRKLSEGTTTSNSEAIAIENHSYDSDRSVKKQRTLPMTADQAIGIPMEVNKDQTLPPLHRVQPAACRFHDHPPTYKGHTDPYDVDPNLASDLMTLYFDHINSAAHSMFPRRPFLSWLETCRHKSAEDLMLCYTMLTLASRFSKCADRHDLENVFARIAQQAIDNQRGKYSLQLVQSRLLLALHFIALDDNDEAWDCSGAAFRAANGLSLNLEESPASTSEGARPYGLNSSGYGECRRRTFWTAYLMDRYHAFWSGNALVFQDEDIFIRLPCDEKSFEEQADVHTSFFQQYVRDAGRSNTVKDSSLGSMAYLVHITSVWGKVVAGMYRSSNMPYEGYQERHEDLQVATQDILNRWERSLPEEMTYSLANADASARSGTYDCFVNMHTLYHMIGMKINRRVCLRHLGPHHIRRNIRQSTRHARELLRKVSYLPKSCRGCPKPILGYAMALASDVVSAKGRVADLQDVTGLLGDCLPTLEAMEPFWDSAGVQRELLCQRIRLLQSYADPSQARGTDARIDGETYELRPLLGEIVTEHDLIYSASLDTYLEAVPGHV